jgi:hypothetical protein
MSLRLSLLLLSASLTNAGGSYEQEAEALESPVPSPKEVDAYETGALESPEPKVVEAEAYLINYDDKIDSEGIEGSKVDEPEPMSPSPKVVEAETYSMND